MNKEQTQAAANYILTYYQDVQYLNHYYAQYKNLLLELETKYGKNPDPNKIQPGHRAALEQILQLLRLYAQKTYLSLKSISETTNNIILSDKLETSYKHITTTYIIETSKALDYILEINKSLLEKIISNLLRTSHEIIEDLYNGGQQP